MISIVKQTIDFYTKYFKTPSIDDLKIEDNNLLERKGNIFITIYKNSEIRGSAGNIKEIKDNIALELIENTITAISKDSRFEKLKQDEVKDIKIRIDEIEDRQVLSEKEKINSIDPVKSGILVIAKDYSNMACILPNIDSKILTGEDYIPVLKEKLKKKDFKEKEYIIYSIKTKTYDNFDIK